MTAKSSHKCLFFFCYSSVLLNLGFLQRELGVAEIFRSIGYACQSTPRMRLLIYHLHTSRIKILNWSLRDKKKKKGEKNDKVLQQRRKPFGFLLFADII